MKFVALAILVMGLSGCASDDGPSILKSTLCGARESACKQRCAPMSAKESFACRQSCEDSAKDKCS